MSIEGVTGIFVSMVRVVMVVLAVLAFAALTWATGLLGDVVRDWAPSIVSTLGPWTTLAGMVGFIASGYVATFWLQRRHERHVYATTGVIEIERPHPWPWWVRALAFAPLALGMVAVIVAASRGL